MAVFIIKATSCIVMSGAHLNWHCHGIGSSHWWHCCSGSPFHHTTAGDQYHYIHILWSILIPHKIGTCFCFASIGLGNDVSSVRIANFCFTATGTILHLPTWAIISDSKDYGASMGPTGGRQDPGGPHVGHMNLAIWDMILPHYQWSYTRNCE